MTISSWKSPVDCITSESSIGTQKHPILIRDNVYRLQQAIARRGRHPESWLWETEDGRQWLTRLVVATLYTFGLKRGVGLETISEFCVRRRLETQVGCSPSA